ncbi:hypothetical protein B0H14DRAFT_3102332 [Mycena olivaceomarginata]|nr:hypothetical protein B0H14DRAFT_3102332 [Mycena olivaceomarginata]
MYLSETRPVVDGDGHVYAVHDPAVEAMEEALRQCSASDAEDSHRRGTFYQEYAGKSHGGGARGSVKAVLMLWLLSQAAFIRLAGFATGASLLASPPDLYEYYAINMPSGRRAHSISGPKHVPLAIATNANLSFGLCAITALGNFDYTKGGHLILWDAKLILEFPPGTTILIPSAAIYHSNIPVAPGERRFSFTSIHCWRNLSLGATRFPQRGLRMAEVQKMAGRWEDGVNHYAYEEELMD